MTAPAACGCGRPIHDTAYRCGACGAMLKRKLGDVARIAGDITLTVARLDKVDRPGGRDDLGWWRANDYTDPRRPATNLAVRATTSRSAMAPVPTPPRLEAAERHDAAVGEIVTWARHILEERGIHASRPREVHPLAHAADIVHDSVEWLRHQPFAEEAWPALLAACGELVRVIDSVPPSELTGLCACGTARYSNDRACTRCGATDLEHDRAALEAAQADYRVTASEAARWIASMGLVRDPGKLRHLITVWGERGHLTKDERGCYRYGDVLSRVLGSPALLRA